MVILSVTMILASQRQTSCIDLSSTVMAVTAIVGKQPSNNDIAIAYDVLVRNLNG